MNPYIIQLVNTETDPRLCKVHVTDFAHPWMTDQFESFDHLLNAAPDFNRALVAAISEFKLNIFDPKVEMYLKITNKKAGN